MKEILKSVPRIVGIIIVICIFCFFGLKGCVVSVWTYPDTPKKYEVVGEDGRSMSMTFLPSKRTIIHYKDPANLESEAILVRMRGTFGTHYIGPIWTVDGPGIVIGLRWVPDGGKPLVMETKCLQKFRIGPGESTFPKVGETSHPAIIFKENAIKFQDMWLSEVEPDQTEIENFLNVLERKNDTEQ